MLKRIVDFEVAPPIRKDSRGLAALGTSALIHTLIILFILFGLPRSSGVPPAQDAGATTSRPIALQPPAPKSVPFKQPNQPTAPPVQQPPQPPPPPLKEVELGPDSKKPDAPAKEAAAKQASEPAVAPPPPPPPVDPPKPATPEPPAPQRIQVPKPGDYTGVGRLPTPTTSPWGPPKVDSASGSPATEPAAPAATSMGRAGLTNNDPRKWEHSFDDETSGRCVEIPDLGKNADGSPVLASVIGRVLDTDGRSPLSGAHLQIAGTQYGTFSDNNGEYRLQFDPRMLAKCRVQYVTVVAPGYRGEQLKLSIGPKVRSDDVVLRHGH